MADTVATVFLGSSHAEYNLVGSQKFVNNPLIEFNHRRYEQCISKQHDIISSPLGCIVLFVKLNEIHKEAGKYFTTPIAIMI